MGENKYPLVSVIVLGNGRLNLLQITLMSLVPHLTYPNWEMLVLNHNESQDKGFRKLLDQAQGEYIFHGEDDWFWMPLAQRYHDWIERCIKVLENYPEVKFIKLRQDADGQSADGRNIRELGEEAYQIECRGVGLNPFFARTKDVKKIIAEIDNNAKAAHFGKLFEIARQTLMNRDKWPCQIAKLKFTTKWARRGICLHTGYGSRQKKIIEPK